MTVPLSILLIVAAAIVVIFASRGWGHPFLTLLVCAAVLGIASDMSFPYTIRSMGEGLAAAVGSVGIVLVASSIAATVLDRSRAGEWLAATLAIALRGRRLAASLALVGFVGGLGAAGEFVFLLLMPLVRVLSRWQRVPLTRHALVVALSTVATNTILIPAPGPVAAAAILSADLWQTALWAAVVAVVVVFVGWAFAATVGTRQRADTTAACPADAPQAARMVVGPLSHGLIATMPVLLPVLLLMASSAGHMPSVPFGSSLLGQLLPALGQPMTLLLATLLAAVITCGRRHLTLLVAEKGWVGQALANVASLVLIVGAAGAFARVLQDTGLSDMLAETLINVQLGLSLPFGIAMAMKLVQGSSMVAVITAAGFMQPLLQPLGLDDETGRALCAVAVGAGSMVASHVNDTLFWTFTRLCGLTPAEGLRLLTLGTLVQGVAAAMTLLVISAVVR